MRKILSIAIALLATSMAWAQPQSAPKTPKYNRDKDVLCSLSGTYQWYSKASAYTYPTTNVKLNYMHFEFDQGSNASQGTNGATNDFSANPTESVHLEIYPMTDITLTFDILLGGTQSVSKSLVAEKWNSVDIPLTDFAVTDMAAVGNLRFTSPDSNADFYVDNYYYHHGELAPRMTIGVPDTEGVAIVTGDMTVQTVTAFLEDIQDEQYKDIVFYNLSGADITKLSSSVSLRWIAANPNAVFGVPGSSNYRLGFIADKTNVGTMSVSNKRFYPLGNVEFVDGYDILYPTYKIGDLPDGYTISYNRPSITGVATTILPFDADVPAGVTAYEFSSLGQDKLVFTPVSKMEAFKPYIVVGSSLQVSSTTTKGKEIAINPASVDVAGVATFTGTFQAISATTTTADDDKYVLSSDVFKKSNGKIGAFRSYMTFAAPSRNFSVVFDDEATGLRPATLNEIEALFNVYSIDGRVVKSKTDTMMDLPAGIYVINGKKVVIK